MSILLIADHSNAALKSSTLNAVSAASKIGGEIHVLVAGQNAQGAAQAASQIAGVSKVLLADSAEYANPLAENLAPLIAGLAKNYSHVVATSSTTAKNVMPRVAALLDVQQLSDISGVESADTFQRPIYAGNAIATYKSNDPIKVVTVRGASFDAAAATGGSAAIEPVAGTGTGRGEDRDLRRARHAERREFQDPRRGCRQARRRGRCLPRGGR